MYQIGASLETVAIDRANWREPGDGIGPGGLAARDLQDLIGGYEQERRVGVDEPADEPRARDPVDARLLPGDPLHRGALPQPAQRTNRPAAPAAAIKTGSGTWTRHVMPSVASAMASAGASTIARRARTMQAPAIAPAAAAVTPATNAFTWGFVAGVTAAAAGAIAG